MRNLLRVLALAALALVAVPLASINREPAPPADPAQAAVEHCGGPDGDRLRRCYDNLLLERVRAEGARPALDLLDRIAARDPRVRRDGHMYAHGIGIAALSSPDRVGAVFASCTPGWQSGCYHGVIQSYFLATRSGAGELGTARVDALCDPWRGEGGNPWLLFQCTHGLGHGLTMFHGHDLPRALASCDLLSRPGERDNCYGGAFMENIVNATEPHHAAAPAAQSAQAAQPAAGGHDAHGDHGDHGAHGGHSGHGQAAAAAERYRALDPSDLHYPCSTVAPKYLDACYTIQTAAMLHHTRQDVARTAQECGRAPERVRRTCFISLGRDVSTIAATNYREAVRLCGLAEEDFQPACHIGVVQAVINMDARPEAGMAYCRFVPAGGSKRSCYDVAGRQALLLVDGEARRERACRRAEADFVHVCLGRNPEVGEPITVEVRRRG
jgi:hypothetical protein